MTLSYAIDEEQRIVRSRGCGTISAIDLWEWIGRLLTDTRFDSSYRSLTDLRSVTQVTLDAVSLARIAATPLFDEDACFAIVADDDCVFGVARMYASFAERIGQTVRVFRTMAVAEAWIGLAQAPMDLAQSHDGSWEPTPAA